MTSAIDSKITAVVRDGAVNMKETGNSNIGSTSAAPIISYIWL